VNVSTHFNFVSIRNKQNYIFSVGADVPACENVSALSINDMKLGALHRPENSGSTLSLHALRSQTSLMSPTNLVSEHSMDEK
jgi:hypothetical protein